MVRSTFLELIAICLISTIVPTTMALSAAMHAARAISLFERAELTGRAETCTLSGYTACNKDGLPSNFCCPSQTECVAFNSGQSAICCPTGKDCSTISAISCDISKQNATAFPSSALFTTSLSATLGICGTNLCCPQGYTCNSSGLCNLSSSSGTASSASAPSSASTASTKSAPTAKSAPTSPATTPLSTDHPTSTPGAANSTASSTATAANLHCSQFPAVAVLVGFFAGLAVGIVLTIIVLCCFGHTRHRKEQPPTSPEFSSVAATVSDPIYQQDANAFRTDFLRRESKSKYANRTSRVRSLFSRTPTLRSMRSREAPVDGIGRSIPNPKTPVNQRSPEPSLKREPSMESIKIYSPPNGGLGRPNTTFTDMMADAGFKQGEPYLGSPGRGED